jgi:DNA transformation protein
MRKKTPARKKPGTDERRFIDQVSERFAAAEGFRARAMFGGHGLYLGDSFFAVVDEGRVYYRVTDETRPDYVAAGMKPFEPWPGQVMNGYYEVPSGVWNDAVLRLEWARRAATRDKKAKKRK